MEINYVIVSKDSSFLMYWWEYFVQDYFAMICCDVYWILALEKRMIKVIGAVNETSRESASSA